MGYVNEQRSDISWKNQNLNMSPNSIMILKKLIMQEMENIWM